MLAYRAFTLVELLVVVTILALLLGIMLPLLGTVRDTGRQTRSMSDLRQMMLGYTQYSLDHNGALLYGMLPESFDGRIVTVEDGDRTFGPPISTRYPWRLAPHLDHAWDVMHAHSGTPDPPHASDCDREALSRAYSLSIGPTFGINSVYVGGHAGPLFKGFVQRGGTAKPNRGHHVVFREAEVQQPSSLIAFTEVRRHGGAADGSEGHFWATAPNAAGAMWEADGDEWEVLNSSRLIGLPEGRYRNRTITGFIDGHIATMRAGELDDMALWANDATDNDYDVP